MAAIDPTNYTVEITDLGIVVDGAGFDPTEGSYVMIVYTYLPDKLEDGTQPPGKSGSANGAFVDDDGTMHYILPSRIITTTPGTLTVSVGQTLGQTVVPVE